MKYLVVEMVNRKFNCANGIHESGLITCMGNYSTPLAFSSFDPVDNLQSAEKISKHLRDNAVENFSKDLNSGWHIYPLARDGAISLYKEPCLQFEVDQDNIDGNWEWVYKTEIIEI